MPIHNPIYRCIHLLVTALVLAAGSPAVAKPPHLTTHGTTTRLIVDGAPFLVLGGQVDNSSLSSPEYFDRVVNKLVHLHAHTVLAPVTWELFEPTEGAHDFGQIESMVRTARKHQVKLIVLWFGSWKNGVSQYAPAGVRLDTVRFPRPHDANGRPMSALSTFGQSSRDAGKVAFTAMMNHLRQMDERDHTVIMVQVENETGLFESRDHCPDATRAFGSTAAASTETKPTKAAWSRYLSDVGTNSTPPPVRAW